MKNNKLLAIPILIISILTLLVSASFAWYQASISIPGNKIETGKLDYTAKGWDEDGNLISTFLSDKNLETLGTDAPANANRPLFECTNLNGNPLSAGDYSTAYITIEYNTSSCDFDYSISFSFLSSDLDTNYLNIFQYKITNVTSSVNAVTGANLTAKIASYASSNKLTAYMSDATSMMNLADYYTTGYLTSTSSPAYAVFRVDYQVLNTATPSAFSGQGFACNLDLMLAQKGSLGNTATSSVTYYVGSQTDLDAAIASLNNGDIIEFTSDFTYTGDLIINNPCTINLKNYCLTLSAGSNMTISYDSDKTTTIISDGKSNGSIKLYPGQTSGGNFTFNAPNGGLVLNGKTNFPFMAVGGEATFNASSNTGLTIDGAYLIPITYPSTIGASLRVPYYIESNTYVYVTQRTTVDKIEAVASATNIKIKNAGIINTISLTNMVETTQIASPQIDILLYSQYAMAIQLPTWSEKFVIGTPNTGNTRIKKSTTSAITLTGCDTYQTSDIEYDYITTFVVDNGTTGKDITVYYQDKYNGSGFTTQSLQNILEDYYTDDTDIDLIEKIKIVSEGKDLTNNDINYLLTLCNEGNGDDKLWYIDLSDTTLPSNSLKTSAFNGAIALTKLILPTSLVYIRSNAVANTSIVEITIPESVTTIESYGLDGIKFIHLLSKTVGSISTLSSYSLSSSDTSITEVYPIILVDRSAYSTYMYTSSYVRYSAGSNNNSYRINNTIANYIYIDGVVDDSGHYVLEDRGDGTYYITASTYRVPTSQATFVVGDNIKLNNVTVTISGVGPGAFRFLNPDNDLTITFANSVLELEEFAFGQYYKGSDSATYDNLKIKKVVFNKVKTVGNRCFVFCQGLAEVDGGDVEYIDEQAFRSDFLLSKVSLPNVVTIKKEAFMYCRILTYVYLKNITTIEDRAFYVYADGNPSSNSIKMLVFDCPYDQIVSFSNLIFGSGNSQSKQALGSTNIYVPSSYYSAWDTNYTNVFGFNGSYPYYIHRWGDLIGTYSVNGVVLGDMVTYDDGTNIYVSTYNKEITSDITIPTGSTEFTTTYTNYLTRNIILDKGAFSHTSISSTANITLDLDEIKAYSFINSEAVSNLIFTSRFDTFSEYGLYNSRIINVVFPDGNLNIANYAIQYNTSLESLTFGSGTYDFGTYAFYGCTKLATVNTETDTLCSGIGQGAFQGSIIGAISMQMTSGSQIFSYAFNGILTLTSANFGSNSYTVEQYAFQNCSQLAILDISGTTGTIGQYALAGCVSLTRAYLPNVITVQLSVFKGDTALQEVFLDSATNMNSTSIFDGCSSLEYIYLGTTGEISHNYSFTIPKTLTDCTIVVRNTLSPEIYASDFVNSTISSGTKIYISNFELIRTYLNTQDGKNTMKNVRQFPSDYAFVSGQRMALESSTVGDITYKYLPYTESGNTYSMIIDTVFASTVSADFTIPETLGSNNVRRIGFGAFRDAAISGGITITGPTYIDSVGAYAFYNIKGFSDINLYNVSNIEQYAFYGTDIAYLSSENSLENIYLADDASSWATYMFKMITKTINGTSITGLEVAKIHSKVNGSGQNNFTIKSDYTISGTTYLVISIADDALDNLDYFTSLVLPANLAYVSGRAFKNLTKLTAFTITTGGTYCQYTITDNSLYTTGNTELICYPQSKSGKSYTVNSSTARIGDYAFYANSKLTSVTLPSNVSVIGNYAFYGTKSNLNVTLQSTTVPYIGIQAFDLNEAGTTFIQKIKVPSASLSTYKSSFYFYKYQSILATA